MPVAEQPESILYFYLTTPRVAAPRWYHEGSAVFVDTWMAGGIGRAQSGYDEMVFRAMVKDDTPFYDPLGLVVRRHEDRFPARDQLVSVRHALHDMARPPLFAREGHRVALAPRGKPRVLRDAVPRRLRRRPSSRRGRVGRRTSTTFQLANLDAIRKFPITPCRGHHHALAGIGVARVLRPVVRALYAAFNYPGVVAHIGAIDTETGNGSGSDSRDIKAR